jgi:hypothetical protein
MGCEAAFWKNRMRAFIFHIGLAFLKGFIFIKILFGYCWQRSIGKQFVKRVYVAQWAPWYL